MSRQSKSKPDLEYPRPTVSRPDDNVFEEVEVSPTTPANAKNFTYGASRRPSTVPSSPSTMYSPDGPDQKEVRSCSIDRLTDPNRDPVERAPTKHIIWSALVPGLFALFVTLGAASAFLIWLYTTRIAIGGRCDYYNKSTSCPGDNGKVLFTNQKVNIILTVSKIVDLAQSTAASCIMMLAAFRISQAWLFSTKEHTTLPEYSELLALCISGRLWALSNAITMLWRRRRRSKSSLLVKAVLISAFAQLVSHGTSLVDIWLHESTVSETTAAGEVGIIPANSQWSRTVNTSCWLPSLIDTPFYTSGGPCSTYTSAIGSAIQHPLEAYAVLSNSSTLHQAVAVPEGPNTSMGIPNLAIVLDANTNENQIFNASTVGISAQCKPVSTLCKLLNVPHGTNSFYCSQIGFPTFGSQAATGSAAFNSITVLSVDTPTYSPNISSNDTTVTAGMPDSSIPQQYLGVAINLPVAGSNPDSEWSGQGVSNDSLAQTGVETVFYCSLVSYFVNYTYTSGTISVTGFSPMNYTEMMTLTNPITVIGPADTISQTTADAQTGNSTTFALAFGKRFALNAMAIGAGGTLYSLPLQDRGVTLTFNDTTIVNLRALFSFLALIYTYAFFIVVLLVMALTSATVGVHKTVRGKGEGQTANLVRLAQLRMTDPAFLVHQLLGSSAGRAKETFVFDLWSKEEREVEVYVTGRPDDPCAPFLAVRPREPSKSTLGSSRMKHDS